MKETPSQKYLRLKKVVCKLVVDILQRNPQALQNFKDIIAKNHEYNGLFEIASAYGHGDDGKGYYRLHLTLNLNHYDAGKMENIVYLTVCYVPVTDNGHEWDVKEMHERNMSNFSPVSQFIDYMESLSKPLECMQQLGILQGRKFSTPVPDGTQRELALF
jgi:hypothetical protein